MLRDTHLVLIVALELSREFGYTPEFAVREAFSREFGLGSTDMLSASVLKELHELGLLLEHKIIR